MKAISIEHLQEYPNNSISTSSEELVVITKNGKPVAVILPLEDEEELERLVVSYSQRFQTILRESRE